MTNPNEEEPQKYTLDIKRTILANIINLVSFGFMIIFLIFYVNLVSSLVVEGNKVIALLALVYVVVRFPNFINIELQYKLIEKENPK